MQYSKKSLSILDPKVLMSNLQIKTTCNGPSKSRDKNVFTFCQDGQCCSTIPLPFQNENCNKERFYQGTEIGECAQFKFGFYGSGKIEGNVTYADLPPEMDINVLFRDGSVTVCTMNDTKLDGNVANEPKFLDFVCKEPKGISRSLVAHRF